MEKVKKKKKTHTKNKKYQKYKIGKHPINDYIPRI
jgi:hypothetical protein